MKYPPNFQDALDVFTKLKEPVRIKPIPYAEQRRRRIVAHRELTATFLSLATPTPQAKEALKILKLGVQP